MLGGFAEQAFRVGPNVGAFSLHREQHFPWLDNQSLLLGQAEVRGWRHFDEAELSDDVESCQVEGEELIDVVCVLQQRLGVHVHIFEEVDDDLLELLVHLAADPLLHDADHLVVVLHAQDQVAHSLDLALVGLLLELLDHCQDVLSVLRVPEAVGELVRQLHEPQQEDDVGGAVAHEVDEVGVGLQLEADVEADVD